jgi:hypothetical protein
LPVKRLSEIASEIGLWKKEARLLFWNGRICEKKIPKELK